MAGLNYASPNADPRAVGATAVLLGGLQSYEVSQHNADQINQGRGYPQGQRNQGAYSTKNGLPLVFISGGINSDRTVKDLGKSHFRVGEKITVTGNPEIFLGEGEVYNYCVCITTGEQFGMVRKESNNPSEEERRSLNFAEVRYFDVKWYNDHCPNGTWQNIWVRKMNDGTFREIGRVQWTTSD